MRRTRDDLTKQAANLVLGEIYGVSRRDFYFYRHFVFADVSMQSSSACCSTTLTSRARSSSD